MEHLHEEKERLSDKIEHLSHVAIHNEDDIDKALMVAMFDEEQDVRTRVKLLRYCIEWLDQHNILEHEEEMADKEHGAHGKQAPMPGQPGYVAR